MKSEEIISNLQNKVFQLKGELATKTAVSEMLRIRNGALETHVKDLEREFQMIRSKAIEKEMS